MLHEPHKDPKAPQLPAEKKPKRFQLVKLEERIAPNKGPHATQHSCFNCGGHGSFA